MCVDQVRAWPGQRIPKALDILMLSDSQRLLQRFCIFALVVLFVAPPSEAFAQCPGNGCRVPPLVDGVPSGLGKAEVEMHAVRERAILMPLTHGVSARNCAAATANAKSARRPDLVQEIARICKGATY